MPYGPRGIYRLIPSLTWQCDEQVASALARVGARAGDDARIVDLGAGGRRISPNTVAVDFVAGPDTDVVGDVQRLPFLDGSVDLVFATGLFEHVADNLAITENHALAVASCDADVRFSRLTDGAREPSRAHDRPR